MRLVERTAPGQLGLNYMWLPTWIGMNAALIREIEEHLTPLIVGKDLTEETLDAASRAVMDYLTNRFSHQAGLEDYLDGLKFVSFHGQQKAQEASDTEENRSDASPPG